jgi:hypothetical protein
LAQKVYRVDHGAEKVPRTGFGASDELLFPYRIESDWERVAKRLGDPGRVTGELTALVGARVMEEHYHPALVDQPTVLEGALSILKSGGRDGIRTHDLLVANEALSQLSYSPTSSRLILAKTPVLANTGAQLLINKLERSSPSNEVRMLCSHRQKRTLQLSLMVARSRRRIAGPRFS